MRSNQATDGTATPKNTTNATPGAAANPTPRDAVNAPPGTAANATAGTANAASTTANTASGAAAAQASRIGAAPAGSEEIELRALAKRAELEACVALQRATWGATYDDCVPASILKVSQIVGGVSAGAFVGERLVGFVYGLTGVREGRLVHWSHMLAVLPEYRNHGVGRRLKEYQRALLQDLGVERMEWTFDPLVARNAHLNLNRLGARVESYVPEMYGDTGSALHAFGTDRFIVSWPVSEGARSRGLAQLPETWRLAPSAEDPSSAGSGVLRVEIPRDVESMDVSDARAWRGRTREAFVRTLGDGYHVAAFVPGTTSCAYILVRREGEGEA